MFIHVHPVYWWCWCWNGGHCLILISFMVTFATPLSTLCMEYNQHLYHRILLPRACHILIKTNSCLCLFLTETVAAYTPSSLSICLALPVCPCHLASHLYYVEVVLWHCPVLVLRWSCIVALPARLFNVKMFGPLPLPGATHPINLIVYLFRPIDPCGAKEPPHCVQNGLKWRWLPSHSIFGWPDIPQARREWKIIKHII